MTDIAEKLIHIVALVRAAIGAYEYRLARPVHSAWIGNVLYTAAAAPHPLPLLAPALWILFNNRLVRVQRRFQALYAAWRAGTLRPTTPRRPRPQAEPAPEPRTAPAAPALPRAFGWMVRRAPEAGPAAGHLEQLVLDEETRRFVAAVPRAGRHLRPLCRALGLVPPDYLRLPPRPRAPRPPRRSPGPSPRPRSAFHDPAIRWRPWEKRAARSFLKKFGRG